MEFYKQILPISIDKKDKKNILKNLTKSYGAIFEGAEDVFLKYGISGDFLNCDSFTGDLYYDKKSGNIFYISIPENKSYIEAGVLSGKKENKETFEDFKSAILTTIMSGRSIDSDHWRTYPYSNEKFVMVKEGALGAEINDEDRSIVKALTDSTLRTTLQEIAKSKNCFIDSLGKILDDNNLFDTLENLANLKLINREYFVYCRETGLQISKVSNLDSIQEASKRGLKCPHCGKTFLDEKIDQGLSLTALGSKFTKKNLWLALYILMLLEKINIDIKNIAVREENNFKDLDIFINHYGQLIHIAIKENQLQANDVYMFRARADIYRADVSILICGSRLSSNNKKYLTSSNNIIVIESTDELENKLTGILENQKTKYISNTITGFECLSKLKINDIIADYFFKEQKDRLESLMNNVDEYTTKSKIESPAASLSGGLISDAKISAEEEEFLISEVINAPVPSSVYEDYADISSAEQKIADMPEEQAGQEAAEEQFSAGEQLSESEHVQEIREETNEDTMEESHMIEETIKVEFAGQQDTSSIPEIGYEEKLLDESYQELKSAIIELADQGLSGHWDEIDDMFESLNKNMSINISLKNGMNIISKNIEQKEQEPLSAYSAEILFAVKRELADKYEQNINSIFIDTPEYNMYIDYTNDYVLTTKTNKNSSLNEVFAASGSADFRESMLKKVFEELKSAEGIAGNILLDENFQPLEEDLDDKKFVDIMQGFTSSFIPANIKLLSGITENKPYRQLCIFTDEHIFSIIPFSDSTVFISIIDASSAREVWNLKIIEGARMLA